MAHSIFITINQSINQSIARASILPMVIMSILNYYVRRITELITFR